MIKFSINNADINIETERYLNKKLNTIRTNKYNELCISGFGTSSLTVLINSKKAFLMYLRNEDDAGFNSMSSINDTEKTIDFLLSNGQMDQYPLHFLVNIDLAEKAILKYYKTGEMWQGIDWIEN